MRVNLGGLAQLFAYLQVRIHAIKYMFNVSGSSAGTESIILPEWYL